MIIYIIIKLLLSYWLVIKKKVISIKRLTMIIDIVVVIIFLFLLYMNKINIHETYNILVLGIIIIIMFILLRVLNEILNKFEEIIKWIESKEKIKKILLNSKINKIIYYFIWSLPWNIGYWTYFWIMENGWYLRVWFCSNRDIFFMKYLGWDSRDFFFKINSKIEEYGWKWIKKNIYDNIIRVIFRIMCIIYILRERILKIKIKEYIWIRIIIYMYLSIFYLYFIFYFHIINYYLFLILILVEIIILIFLKQIINFFKVRYMVEITELYNRKIIGEEFVEMLVRLMDPLEVNLKWKFEINKYIWDKTLSNSVSLNILYKYMIWVNKNTEGYYDRKMNIRSRVHRVKFLEERSIIWDILPRTRYVIISFKYLGYEYFGEIIQHNYNVVNAYEFSNLSKNKNFYLGYYEKTYSKTSLMLMIWVLRMNLFYYSRWDNKISQLLKFKEINKKLSRFKSNLEEENLMDLLLYFYCFDKRFFGPYSDWLDCELIFNLLLGKCHVYYFEEFYCLYNHGNIMVNRKNLDIPEKFMGLRTYKVLFKIMGRIQLHEEESVVWNNSLQEIVDKKNKIIEEDWENPEGVLNMMFLKFIVSDDDEVLDLTDVSNEYIERYKKRFSYKIKTSIELEKILKLFADYEYWEKRKEFYEEFGIKKHKELDEKIKIVDIMWERWIKEDPDIEYILYLRILLYCNGFDDNFITGEKREVKDNIEIFEKFNFKG